jgi:Type VI secretion system/phage-baseplate injector OB domain
MNGTSRYYGIYRGTVVNNVDPMMLGRIMALVPDVGGVTPSSWAMPCVPIAGKQMGTFMVPQIGAGVWMMFEGGDPDRPVWVGGWWGNAAEVPLPALAGPPGDPNIVLQSTLQNTVMISDAPPAITLCAGPLASPTSPRITVTPVGIIITNGVATIAVAANTVTINNGALVVM